MKTSTSDGREVWKMGILIKAKRRTRNYIEGRKKEEKIVE